MSRRTEKKSEPIESFKKNHLNHLAVIMDGNGRWAAQHKHRRLFGHIQGAKTSRWLIQHCSRLKIPFLSLFALSTENVKRPKIEVEALKKLLEKVFLKHSVLLKKEKIKLHILGDISVFPLQLQNLCKKICEETKEHRGMNLIVALNYGGRQEILQAVQKIVRQTKQGQFQTEDLSEESFSSFLSSSHFPPPDLIIRTGGQFRLSNFYLWSSAYSELYFTDTLWPDFDQKVLEKALEKFSTAQRRFGRIKVIQK